MGEFMLGELYRPKGLALETAQAVLEAEDVYAVNVASGCDNKCKYPCYVPGFTHAKAGEMRFPKKDPVELIRKQFADGLKTEGVFLCFLTDPLHPKNMANTENIIHLLQESGIHNIATLSKMGIVDWKFSPVKNGMTIVSFDEKFWGMFEHTQPCSCTISPEKRLATLEMRKEMEGDPIWISCEPYPPSEIYPQNFRDFLSNLKNVDLIVFGKWNYDPRANTEKARQEYAEDVHILKEFCKTYGIRYHIKSDTLDFIQGRSTRK